jgi:hypothetical protein
MFSDRHLELPVRIRMLRLVDKRFGKLESRLGLAWITFVKALTGRLSYVTVCNLKCGALD